MFRRSLYYPCYLLLLSIVLFTSCSAENKEATFTTIQTYDASKAYYPNEKWSKIGTPETMSWSADGLNRAQSYSKEIGSDAVVIVENGIIVGAWGDLSRRYPLHSVRKSLLSSMIGIAVDERKMDLNRTLKSLHITDRGGLSEEEQQTTVLNLLKARSGVYHPAAYETESMRKKRPVRGSHKPGTFWFYNNWDFNALVTIYNKETKRDFFKSFEKKIAQPLQMEYFRLEYTQYNYQRKYSDHPAYHFKMSPLDLARFGLLYLREGRWHDKQLISKKWIYDSTFPWSSLAPRYPDDGYGYMWWTYKDRGKGYYAAGSGGQYLIIDPEDSLIVVHNADTNENHRVSESKIWKLYDRIREARFGTAQR